ncbi:MAG: NUDIX hydrolase [Thermotogae bacterium]|nr:MAG: NUDIX hydrolase [Thermotogota bacterium]
MEGKVVEMVLVVPTSKVIELLGPKTGIVEVEEQKIQQLIQKEGLFIPRNQAEQDESFQQIIPYVVMKNNGQILLLLRTSKQGEKRLHDKYSLGVGGHINNLDDQKPWNAFLKGMKREITEEVDVEIHSIDYIGIINDTSTPVSRVHLGLLYIAEVNFKGIREKDMFMYWWKNLEELQQYTKLMEGWSFLTYQELKRRMPN